MKISRYRLKIWWRRQVMCRTGFHAPPNFTLGIPTVTCSRCGTPLS